MLCSPKKSIHHPQVRVAQKVTTGVYKGVTTSELDELAAETAASMTATHPDYAIVGCPHNVSELQIAASFASHCLPALVTTDVY